MADLRRFDVTLHVTGSEAFGRVEVSTKRVMDPDGMYAIYEDVASRLAAADRLAEAARPIANGSGQMIEGRRLAIREALADYEAKRKGEEDSHD